MFDLIASLSLGASSLALLVVVVMRESRERAEIAERIARRLMK